MAGVMIGGVELNARKRRELGLTRKSIRQELRKMRSSGELVMSAVESEVVANKTVSEIALDIAFKLVTKHRVAYCRVTKPGRDWENFFDKLIAFIERVLPLIMQSMVL